MTLSGLKSAFANKSEIDPLCLDRTVFSAIETRFGSPFGVSSLAVLRQNADVAELVDAPDLGSGAARRGGSSPLIRTNCLDYGWCS